MTEEYLIGELANRADVSSRTVRYYETMGLLEPYRHEEGKFRYYTDAELARLQKILRMKSSGFSLEEIRQLIDLIDGNPVEARQGKRQLLKVMEGHLQDVESKLEALTLLSSDIKSAIQQLQKYIDEQN